LEVYGLMPDDLARFTIEELDALGEALKAKDEAARAVRRK
jgi:hypothetical protein